jgi:hypothetical protein
MRIPFPIRLEKLSTFNFVKPLFPHNPQHENTHLVRELDLKIRLGAGWRPKNGGKHENTNVKTSA